MSSIGNPHFDENDTSEVGHAGASLYDSSSVCRHIESRFMILNRTIRAQGTETRESLRLSNPTSFPLLQLPLELRLLIYEPLIAAGDLNIMRTNKVVHKEATKVMKKNAILRMIFGYANRTSSASFPLTGSLNLRGSLTLHATPIIQQVEFHFRMDDVGDRPYYFFDVYANLINSFGGRDVVRQSCTIFLNLGLDRSVPTENSFALETAWRAITGLTGFKTLVLKIRRDKDYEFEAQCIRQLGRLIPENENSYPHRSILTDYKTVREVLESTLGPAIQDKSLQGHCLKFHPSEFKPGENGETDRAA